MSAKNIGSMVLTLLCIGLVARVAAASPASEIQWIAGLPGVTLATSVDQGHGCENVYTVVGSTAGAVEAIRARLVRDGWKVQAPSTVSTAAGAIRGLVAHRGGRSLRVTGHEAAGIGGLVVSYSTDAPGQQSPGTGERMPPREPNASQGPVVQGSGDISVDEGNQRQTYQMDGSSLTINSSHNRIVVMGRCKAVVLNGSHNRVTVQGRVAQIHCNGSWNKVQWSRSKNPSHPECTNWGMDNQISPIE